MRLLWSLVFIISSILFLHSCSEDLEIVASEEYQLMQIPDGFPTIDFPLDNSFTNERWVLGKRLFNDKNLSLNNTISCASCHKSELAFSDDVTLSLGTHNSPGKSNAPTLTNIAYHPYFTRAGGVPTLEMQVLVPVQEHDEFDFNIVDLAGRLSKDSTYNDMAQSAYGRDIDPFVITRAIANYERSFISGNSSFDKYMHERDNALSDEELNGMNLFFSNKTNCSSCHSGFNFTNYSFENNGLYEVYADSGRMKLTMLEEDRALFKTPTLRNVAFTSPYMHDGSITSLEQVVEHYNGGGKNHVNKNTIIKPLNLTDTEKMELVSFLKSLSDNQFTSANVFK